MSKLKTADLVNAIAQLNMRQTYSYYSGATKIKVTEVIKPEGAINFIRWGSKESQDKAKKGSISTHQLAPVAAVLFSNPNSPIDIRRIIISQGGSRSALEVLIALTPNFFICYPSVLNPYTGENVKESTHLMWCPDETHPLGEIVEKELSKPSYQSNHKSDSNNKQFTFDMIGINTERFFGLFAEKLTDDEEDKQ